MPSAAYEHVPGALLCRRFELDRFPFFWHFHPELELTLIERGSGRRHVGDHVGAYGPGDLVLLGPDLPHSWLSSRTADGGPSTAVVVRFARSLFGDLLDGRPELDGVRRLLDGCGRGLAFPASEALAARLAGICDRSPLHQLLELLDVLDTLAARRASAVALASVGYRPALREDARRRVRDVCAYVGRHHERPLTLTEVAGVAHLSPSAFSRAFRRETGQTFTGYVNEVRVGAACRLLVETERPIGAIAADVGFRNLANFNRRFRELRGTTPRAYRAAFGREGPGVAAPLAG